jgi:DNA-binding transcriptional MocR family regulator
MHSSSGLAIDEQIAAHFAAAIAAGQLAAGERLPTIRAVAAEWDVPRAVAHAAYRRLQNQGLVLATVGRGTVVAEAKRNAGELVDPLARAARAALRACESASGSGTSPAPTELIADFAQFLPDSAAFAVDEFGAAIERVLRARGRELLGYGNPTGDGELRRLLVARAQATDPSARADDVLVTSGAQQGIDLVLRTFTAPGDAVVVPVPCYHHLFGLLASHGLDVLPVAWNEDGVDGQGLARALRSNRARLLYVMPTFQNPTGRTLDGAQRRALLDIVARTRVPILEDDCASELRFAGTPQPSLRSLDARALTVTVRSFSKELFPGVRIGWLSASPSVLPAMAALKRYCDLETTPLLQAALVDFITRGSLDRHLDKMRQELRARHAAAHAALARTLPHGATWTRPDGSFALWLTIGGDLDGEALAAAASRRGVLVTPGATFDPERRPTPSVRLSLSRVSPAQIEAGCDILGACARALRAQRDGAARRPVFL